MYSFPPHNHQVAISPYALHILYSPTAWKNSYLVGVGTTRVTKSVHSSCACSIGYKPQNTRFSSFFWFDSLCVSMACRFSKSASPFVCTFISCKIYSFLIGCHVFFKPFSPFFLRKLHFKSNSTYIDLTVNRLLIHSQGWSQHLIRK